MAVRVRFAPSPTGELHLGGARTALYNYLFAKANKGLCVLRIEDTDTERNVPGSAQRLQGVLEWLGVRFDEGPGACGKYGPYVQSERLEHYQKYAKQLVQDKDSAYHCFCKPERLQALRTENVASGYDRQCRTLSSRQVDSYLQMGLPHTIRLKIPESGVTTIADGVYGEVQVPNETIDDQILLKSDGWPTYHFANVVDDHMMEISHVLRGEEWLLSTVKHLTLYKAFGWEPPKFAHLPLLHSSTGEKLSKRKHNATVEYYREKGFLPEALVNFLALLGWSPRNSQQELFTMEDLIQSFSLEGVSKRGVAVNEAKMEWLNGLHFKRRCQSEAGRRDLAEGLQKYLKESSLCTEDRTLSVSYLEQVLQLLEERISLLPRIPSEASYFWHDPPLTKDELNILHNPAQVLGTIATKLEQCEDSREAINVALKQAATEVGAPYNLVMLQCRLIMTGTKNSPALSGIMATIGKEVTQRRLKSAISLC